MEENADRSPVFHDGRIHAGFVSSERPVNAPQIGVASPRALSAHQSRLSPVSSSSFPLYQREMLGDGVYKDVGSGIRPTLMLPASRFFVIHSFICGWPASSMLGLDPPLLSFSGDLL